MLKRSTEVMPAQKDKMYFFYACKNFILGLFQKTTVGVQILVIRNAKILLIRHTYTPEWHLLGGGVDTGETPHAAACREIYEEGGIVCKGALKLFGFYYNPLHGRHDYLALYICENFGQIAAASPEIDEVKWFPITGLPSDLSSGAQRRIAEYRGQAPISERW